MLNAFQCTPVKITNTLRECKFQILQQKKVVVLSEIFHSVIVQMLYSIKLTRLN